MNQSNPLLDELRIDRSRASQTPPRRTAWLVVLALVVLAAIGAAAYVLMSGRAVAVEVATARAPATAGGASASVLDASGYVVARRQATVSAKITGKVAEVLIEEGMRVDEGQVLARLDATDANAQRELAEAQLANAQSQLGEVQANLTLAQQNFERQRELVDRGLVAQSLLDAAIAERDAFEARLASARRAVDVARESLRVADIGVDNTVVRAPFAGVVVAKAAQPGEMISPISAGGGFTRTGIGTIVDMESLEVQVDVNEAFIGRVKPGQPVEAVLNAYPDWRIPGSVIAIIPTADRSKATVKVRIALGERDPRIVPEMGVRVSFLEEGAEVERAAQQAAPPPRGVLVPSTAVLGEGDAAAVFVVEGETVERRSVRVSQAMGSDRLIGDGLRAGERVVLSPPSGLADGDRVRVESG